jgi:glycosyltransferase involved in cell wall biosynthesis
MIILSDNDGSINGARIVTNRMIELFRAEGIPVTIYNTNWSGRKYAKLFRIITTTKNVYYLIRERLNSEKLLYVSLAGGLALFAQSLLIQVAKFLGFEVIVHHHSYNYIRGGRFVKLALFTTRSIVSHIFLTEQMYRDFQDENFNVSRYYVISNAYLVSKSSSLGTSNSGNMNESLGFTHFGNLSTEKGSNKVLELYSQMLQNDWRVKCSIFGPTNEEEILKKIDYLRTKYPSKFSYQNKYEQSELGMICSQSDFFLFPSSYANEAAPLVIYEAQLNGLICFSSTSGSLKSIVRAPGRAFDPQTWLAEVFELVTSYVQMNDSLRGASLVEAKTSISRFVIEEAEVGKLEFARLLDAIWLKQWN